MNDAIVDTLTRMTSPLSDVRRHALLQLAMLLEKNHRASDEQGFYESILPAEMLAIELSEREQQEVLAGIAERSHSPGLTASFLWAVGKSSPKAGMPVLLHFLRDHPELLDDPDASYQAVIALENCLDHDEDEIPLLAEGSSELEVAVAFLKKGARSSDEKLAGEASRLFKRLRSRRRR
jgi:hypothetical protein